MRILLAGGGTAGHINPALAIASYVKEHSPDVEILYVGAVGGMEERLVPQAGFNFKGIKISGFQRKLNLQGIKKNIVTVKRMFTSSVESKKIIKDFKPDVCIGTGGYVSGPVLRKAAKMGIPILIHEQNAYPGVTTKLLSKYAKWVMLAVESSKKFIPDKANVVVTGNPVRKEVIEASKFTSRQELGLDNRPVILSFGGSLGARKINEAVADLMVHTAKNDKFQHIHGYGQYGKCFPDELEKKGVNILAHRNFKITEYINNMSECLAAADLVICRAGAITLSELQAQGKPSILIPSPNVAENHQYHNAMALVNEGAAEIIEEKDLTGDKLVSLVEKMLSDKRKLKEYQENAKKMAILDTTERIYLLIREVVNQNKVNCAKNKKHQGKVKK